MVGNIFFMILLFFIREENWYTVIGQMLNLYNYV